MKAARPGKLRRQEDQASFVSWRFALLCGCILLAMVGLMLRVAYLQVINPDRLVKEGDMRSLRVQEVPTARGMISDRAGRPLAVSVPVNAVWADPKELNERGGIESDVTVARHGPDNFMVMSSIARTRRDHDHLRRQIQDDEDVRLRDVTSAFAVLSIAGPKARDLLSAVCDIDLSDEAFPINSLQQFQIGHAPVFAQRLSYTGALGWEIFVTPDFAEHVFDVIWAAGAPLGLRLIGGEALNALRVEKGFLHWGSDMSYTEAPHQIGLTFVCKPDAAMPFVGQAAFLARKAAGKGPFLCHVKLDDPGAMLHHNEPVLINDTVAGYVSSAAFVWTQNAAIGLCFINTDDKTSIENGSHSVLVEGRKVPAKLRLKPFPIP